LVALFHRVVVLHTGLPAVTEVYNRIVVDEKVVHTQSLEAEVEVVDHIQVYLV
jgi:hypothetical protein